MHQEQFYPCTQLTFLREPLRTWDGFFQWNQNQLNPQKRIRFNCASMHLSIKFNQSDWFIVKTMQKTYSTFEPKTKFSEVMRAVINGHSVTVTYHGQPVAEVRPLSQKITSNEQRLSDLEKRGACIPAKNPLFPLANSLRALNPLILKEFLRDRNN